MTPSSLPGLRRLTIDAGIVILSGIMWDGLWLLNRLVMSEAIVTSGISLVYLPAGFRLLIILLFGGWGALGIFLSEPLLYFREFGTGSLPQVMVTAAISAFSPWIVTRLFCRAMGIRRSLDGLMVAGSTDAFVHLFGIPGRPARSARRLGLAAVERLPALKRFFMNEARGTTGTLPRLLQGMTV